VLGIVIFLVGVALLAFTFKLAYEMFVVPPDKALGVLPNQPLDLGVAGQSLVSVLIKVLMLAVMGLMGSLIANRGVSLFAGSRTTPRPLRESVIEPHEKAQVTDSK
ncbi:MAG: hypothetical protein H7Y17_10145, partial [Chlorobia bacterium]|nr:hypothetical protein [Fimbriimonadaceae bacterium]